MSLLPPYLQHLLLVAYLTPFFFSMAMFCALIIKKNKSKSAIALQFVFLSAALIILVFVKQFFFSYSGANHIILHYPHLLTAVVCVPVTIIYFTALLRPGKLTTRKVLEYLTPSLVALAATALLLLTGTFPKIYFYRENFLADITTPGNIVRLGLLAIFLCQLVVYAILILHMLYKFRNSVRNKYSYTSGVKLTWAYWALLAIGLFAVTPLSMLFFEYIQIGLVVVHIAAATASVLIMFFAGFHQPALYADEDQDGYAESEQKGDSGMVTESLERIKKELLELFEEKKCYQATNLSIDDISKTLNTNRTYVSRIINEDFGLNFYGFVNKYRLAEFMHRLHSSPNDGSFKIKEVSEQVGFKSYTSFFNFFKEQTGYTPSEYIKKLSS